MSTPGETTPAPELPPAPEKIKGPPPPPVVEPSAADTVPLEGPQSRLRELFILLRAIRDFMHGFRALHFVGPCVTVFGSARFPPGQQYYELGREVGRRVGEARLHRDDRRRTRRDGGGQSRRQGGGRAIGRV